MQVNENQLTLKNGMVLMQNGSREMKFSEILAGKASRKAKRKE
jgi:hypothetical protein